MTKPLTYRIGADLGDLARGMDEGVRKTASFKRALAELEAQQRRHRAAITDLGQGVAGFGIAVAAGLGVATKAAISWESAFAGVKKTVDGTPEQIAALEGELRNLARTLPATHEEIAGVAEAAGQLGIKRQDIAAFTRTMIDLGVSTNLTAEQAATSLAKFSNIMGTSASNVSRLGATLVALGNDGASTEADILELGLRIAGAGHVVGLTEAQVLSFASAISSVGIEAEAGGTAFSTSILKMSAAVRSGGESLETFAATAGLTADQFSAKFRGDAAGAVDLFIQGLSRMQAKGGDVVAVLDAVGLSDVRVRNLFLAAAGASDFFTHSLQVGTRGWAENTALADEAGKRYATTEARIKVSGNQIKDALIDVGAAIAPALAAGVQSVADVARAFSELPGPVKEVVAIVGLAAAGITLVGGAALIAYPKVLAFQASMRELVATGTGVGSTLGKFGLFMAGPWGAALGLGVTLLGAFAAASGGASRNQQELAEAGKSVADAIREQNGVINESVRSVAAKKAAETGMLDLARQLGIDLPTVTDAIVQQGTAYEDLNRLLSERIPQAGPMDAEAYAAEALKKKLNDLVGSKNDDLKTTKDVNEATAESSTEARKNAAAMEEENKQAAAVAEAYKALVENLNKLNGITLSAREAQRNYLEVMAGTAEAIGNTDKALIKNGGALDINTEAGRTNQAQLDAQAKAAGDLAEALAHEAEKQGGAGAGAAAFAASLDASRPALIKNAEALGMDHDAAVRYANSVLAAADITAGFGNTTTAELARVRAAVMGIPPEKSINVGALTVEAEKQLVALGYHVQHMPDGTVVVSGNTAPAYAALNNFLNARAVKVVTVVYQGTVPGGFQKVSGRTGLAQGGIVAFAGGGMWENHAPQIARASAGMVRVWAEPETASESYIPWAMDRRPRATAILGQTAEAFGYSLTPRSQLVGGGSYHSAQSTMVVLNANVIGSQRELENWLARAMNNLKIKGRA